MLQGRAKTYAIAQAVICSLGFLSGLAAGGLLLVFGLFSSSIDPATAQDSSMMLVIGWTSLLVALANLIGLIVVYYAWKGKPLPRFKADWQRWLLIGLGFVWLISIVGAMTLSSVPVLNILTSAMIIPLVLVPIVYFVWIGARKLSIGSHLRAWGAVAYNFSIMLPVVLMLELVLFIFVFVFVVFWLMGKPEILSQVLLFGEQMSNGLASTVDMEEMLVNLVQQPFILNGSLLVVSVLVPLIEELFKPSAVWFLAGKRLTPRQGFVGGLIGGACFALLESLGAVGIPADSEWLILLFGRTGTGLLHVALSGMVGWGVASGFYSRNWLRALLTYALAVTIHGLWNFFALLSGISPILPISDQMNTLPVFLGQIGVFVLVFLFGVNMVLLFRMNKRLGAGG